jgi:hypothetical protein
METTILDQMKDFLGKAIEKMGEDDKQYFTEAKVALEELEKAERTHVSEEQLNGLLHAFYTNTVKQAMFALFTNRLNDDALDMAFFNIDFKAAKAKYEAVIKALADKQKEIEEQTLALNEIQNEMNSLGNIFNKAHQKSE